MSFVVVLGVLKVERRICRGDGSGTVARVWGQKDETAE